jgi:hypothetical protein
MKSGMFTSVRIFSFPDSRIPDSRIRICKTGFDADPKLDPTFHFVCRSRSGSYPKFYTCWNHSSASQRCFIFLVSVIDVKNILYFWQYIEIFWKKAYWYFSFSTLVEIDPDPAKWCRSDRIRIYVFVKYDVTRYQHPGTILYYPADPHYPVKSHTKIKI